ncbi:MAG: hypothetical protein KDC10_15995, partial [Calditrichaeota bacterium]|nr:hypothetical protein [Calditrichota bacterium]
MFLPDSHSGGCFVRIHWYFFLQFQGMNPVESIENQILEQIEQNGTAWAFTPKDFSRMASRQAVDLALHRLARKGTIRRVMRGVYDIPRPSQLLQQTLSPNLDSVANALARRFGWRIQPSGATALNLLGLSTQVPGRTTYLSDGPNRKYLVGNTELVFQHTAVKEAGFKLRESELLVQGL